MRKRFCFIFLFFIIFLLKIETVYGQENCHATLIVHYHNHKEVYNHELHVFEHLENNEVIEPSGLDGFGLVFDVSLCNITNDNIKIMIKEKDQDFLDNVLEVDVSDIKGTHKTKHIYVLEGTKTVYDETYFASPNNGYVIIIYYDKDEIYKWQDFHIWGISNEKQYELIPFAYFGENNLFRIGIINVPRDSDELIGLRIRKNINWNVVDDEWAKEITNIEYDELGHVYKENGERFINVSDVIGSGYKFIYLIKGDKTIYEDFDLFFSKIAEIEITEAIFQSKNTLLVEFNQDIKYNPEAGPDVNQFKIIDNEGNLLNIEKIIYDKQKSSDNKFKLILTDKVENKPHNITYQFKLLGNEKVIEKEAVISDDIFSDLPVEDINHNLIYYIIGGIVILLLLGGGLLIIYRRKE